MKLSKTFTFDAAHHLPNYKGACARPHGHEWTVEVVLSGPKNEKTGMLIDFHTIKFIIQDRILSKLDHYDLNDIISNPTAENIAEWIFLKLEAPFKVNCPDLTLEEINVWEQPTSKVTYP